MLKKLSALLLILSIGIVSAFAADSALYVKEKTHNFGTIREADGPVRCEFILQNNGDKPLGQGTVRMHYAQHTQAADTPGRNRSAYRDI